MAKMNRFRVDLRVTTAKGSEPLIVKCDVKGGKAAALKAAVAEADKKFPGNTGIRVLGEPIPQGAAPAKAKPPKKKKKKTTRKKNRGRK